MNVLHVRERLERGGIEILIYNLFKNINETQNEFHLVTFADGTMDAEFSKAGVHIISLKRRMKIDLKLVRDLRNLIIEKKINVIHSHQAVEGFHSYLASRGLGIKNVISHHGSVYPFKDKLVMKFLIPKIDANIVVSNSYLKRLKEVEGFNITDNFHVIYNGIDPEYLKGSESTLREELSISKTSMLLGMIGNFYNSGRDQYTICKVLPMLFDKFKDLHFVFVGGWSLEQPNFYNRCYNFCEKENLLDRTHFIGARSDIGNILRSMDIFVYSSNHDTFGIAVVEAMLSGLPVVANDIPAMMEITDNGKYARIFETKNSKSLFDEISFLINNNEARNAQAILGQKWASERYTITKHISNLTNLYEKIIHN